LSSKETNQEFFGHYWNENMINYLDNSAGGRWFKYLLDNILAEIKPGEVHSVADIGCGAGNKTAQMAEYFKKAKVTGYDFAADGIAAASNHYDLPNLNFATEDITEASYTKRFDIITAFDVLEHIDDWKGLTKGLIKVNNRYMILASPVGRMRPYEVHIGHYRNFKRHEIEDFMESQGYVTRKTYYAGFPFHSPILRDLTNIFFKNYAEMPQAKMSFLSKRMHDIWYVLFRYLSLQHKGDIFVGLFEKADPVKQNGPEREG
jgi:SAM-dependent methyltransferase